MMPYLWIVNYNKSIFIIFYLISNNQNVNHLIEPEMFEASCEEATFNFNLKIKKHHITNES